MHRSKKTLPSVFIKIFTNAEAQTRKPAFWKVPQLPRKQMILCTVAMPLRLRFLRSPAHTSPGHTQLPPSHNNLPGTPILHGRERLKYYRKSVRGSSKNTPPRTLPVSKASITFVPQICSLAALHTTRNSRVMYWSPPFPQISLWKKRVAAWSTAEVRVPQCHLIS